MKWYTEIGVKLGLMLIYPIFIAFIAIALSIIAVFGWFIIPFTKAIIDEKGNFSFEFGNRDKREINES